MSKRKGSRRDSSFVPRATPSESDSVHPSDFTILQVYVPCWNYTPSVLGPGYQVSTKYLEVTRYTNEGFI